MVRSFGTKHTQEIWDGNQVRLIPVDVQHVARRKLRMINNAQSLQELRVPPNNRLEKLKGERAGQFSIRVNRQWRICFRWTDGDAHDVELVDYH
jgi:proteic killer suppression protein